MMFDGVLSVIGRLDIRHSRLEQLHIVDVKRFRARHRAVAVFATGHPKDGDVLNNLGGEGLLPSDAAPSVQFLNSFS